MNKCIPEVVKTMLACITCSLRTGRLGSEHLTRTLQACKMIFAPLADFLFAYWGQVSQVAQLAEEGDETPWYKEFSRPTPSASNGRHKVVRTSLLRKVDMLSIGVEDTLPHYMVEEIAAGFKKTLAFQTCASKQDGGKGIVLDHQSESWQPPHFTPRVGVRWREGHVVRRGHVEKWRGGHARDYTVKENEDAGFPYVRHQTEQRLFKRGYLSPETESSQLLRFTCREGLHGRGRHAEQRGHVERWFGGHAHIHGRGVCGWLKEGAGFPDGLNLWRARQPCCLRLSRAHHLQTVYVFVRIGHVSHSDGQDGYHDKVTRCQVYSGLVSELVDSMCIRSHCTWECCRHSRV